MGTTKIEIFWDDQDPQNEGWVLRVTHADGGEEEDMIDDDKDREIAFLSLSAAPYLDDDVDPQTLAWVKSSEGLGWSVRL